MDWAQFQSLVPRPVSLGDLSLPANEAEIVADLNLEQYLTPHKPAVIRHKGVLYHFYCACRPAKPGDQAVDLGDEFRCITVATSEPL